MPLLDSTHTLSTDCFALLDDCTASIADPRSRLYTGHAGTLSCADVGDLPVLLKQMQQALQQGQYAIGLFPYELGAQMHGITSHAGVQDDVQVLLFKHCERLSTDQVTAWLDSHTQSDTCHHYPAGIANIHANVSENEFRDAVTRIHAYLEAGDTYQVNYTYRLRFDAFGSPLALYRRLRASQPVPYGALIALPDGRAVLSLSPELFVQHVAGELTARPMKGTAAAGNAEQDAVRTTQLATDPKTRAENLMIVDLLRNDLGRVAASGSVRVPALFDVQRYSSVLQMTSTVCARIREDVTLPEIFSALFPCGSITGAPKHRTMQIIRELETEPRGLYTGAIGYFDAPSAGQTIGNFCLSVPIRTLVLQAPQNNGIRAGEMGVGAGIVHDSVAADEYAECQLKARFLTDLSNDFELFETIHATQTEGCRHLDRHLQRMRTSAMYFGFKFDEAAIRNAARRECAALPPDSAHRLRLALNQIGICSIKSAPLLPLSEPVKLLVASQPTIANDLFLRHKTTVRERYDEAWRAAEAQGAFDMLFCNTQGELTEGGRSNVLIKLDGRWTTPPLAAGLLPGVMRAVLLEDPNWNVQVRRLTMQDLHAAEEILVCNALRGVLRAVLD
ncbi:MAG TPA: aminodeoxychorismate synthase component I [Burkholderiaceae bacterium]